MTAGNLNQEDIRALELIDDIMGRFEADAGFALPGLTASEIPSRLAEATGAGSLDEPRLQMLEASGLLSCVRSAGRERAYALSQEAMKLVAARRAVRRNG